jgi:hypothetical protein
MNALLVAIGLGPLLASLVFLSSMATQMAGSGVQDTLCQMEAVRRLAIERIAADEQIDVAGAGESCQTPAAVDATDG